MMKPLFSRRLITLAFSLGLAIAALPARAEPGGAPPLRVVASFSILADMVREVGGDAVDVSALVGPDSDAHVFEPSPADAKRIAQADLVVVNGLGFEGWLERLIRSSGYHGPVLVATVGVTPRILGGADDPHAWQSLAMAKLYVENIRAGLVRQRPLAALQINARAADYQRRIASLDESTKARFAAIPVAERHVVTSHDAFGYFGAAYGVKFSAPQGWSTASEASAADVARIVRQLKADRVRALFVENISDPRMVERIAQEAGARIGGTLYSDALSRPGTPGDTYLRMFAHNVTTLLAALKP